MENIIIKNTGFSEYEARIKLLVLSFSLRFESLTSDYLCKILNINRLSKSLGNTSEALSMEQKVRLMLDTNYFNNSDKETIRRFQSIRNQFMHNAAAKSFESCLSFLNGMDKTIEKAYQKKKTANLKAGGEKAAKEKADEEINNKELLSFDINDKEKLLFKCWNSLTEDVIICFETALKKLVKK